MATLRESAQNGRKAALVALRDALAAAIDECESGRDLAALSRQFSSVLTELEGLEPAKSGDEGTDDLAAKRAARRADAQGRVGT